MNGASRELWLNVAPLVIPSSEITVEVLPYDDHETLKRLRRANQGRFLFKRGSEKLEQNHHRQIIYAVKLTADEATVGGESRKVSLQRELGLAAALMRECLTNMFAKAKSRQLMDFNPLQVLLDESADLIRMVAGNEVPPWLTARVLLEVDVRVFHFDGAVPFVGIIANPRIRRRISRNCADWLEAGFDLKRFWVSERIPREDTRFQPELQLCGKVDGIEGEMLRLTDCRDGRELVRAGEVELEAKSDAWSAAFRAVFGAKGDTIRRQVEIRQTSLAAGNEKFARVEQTLSAMRSRAFEVLPGVAFQVGEPFHEGAKQFFPAVEQCPPALYVFDPAGNRPAEQYAAVGLNKHGPYNQATQTPVKPRICVICESRRRGEVEQFLHKFFRGIPDQGRRSYFPLGFSGTYRLRDPEWRCFTTDGQSAAAYHRAAIQALEAGGSGWNLAIVQTDEASHDLHGEENPYLVSKATFLSQQIPVQGFEVGTMSYRDKHLEFALSDMALASYAKIGGVPWVLQVTKPYAHELVIGIGSATIADSRLGRKQRVVGITTMFTDEGQYLLGNLSRAVPFEDYERALSEMLVASVTEARSKLNWQKNEEVRLVFHSFKPLRDEETANAALAVAEHLKDFAVEIAFIHVAQDQPLKLFDKAQEGVMDWEIKAKKGVFAPNRGQYLMLNRRESLLALTGPKDVKRATDGLPSPVVLKLHRESKFTDLHYLTRQVFAFSSHSWRGFSAAPMPVTVLYSQLIARLLGRLETLPKWNPDALIGRINRLRWFL